MRFVEMDHGPRDGDAVAGGEPPGPLEIFGVEDDDDLLDASVRELGGFAESGLRGARTAGPRSLHLV